MESKELREEFAKERGISTIELKQLEEVLDIDRRENIFSFEYVEWLEQKIIKLKENMQKAIFEELSPRPEICHGCANKLLDRLKIKPKAIKKSLNEEKQDE
jgi:hypothetical protein